jgi:predicted transcriptional regulator
LQYEVVTAAEGGKMPEPKSKLTVMVIGSKLTDARIEAGYSMDDVVVLLGDGINKSSISRWEQGVLNPSRKRVKKLIEIYKRNDFVVEGEGK